MLWRDPVDRGIGKARQRHGLGQNLLALIGPFRRHLVGQSRIGQNQQGARRRAHGPPIEQQPTFVRNRHLFIKPLHSALSRQRRFRWMGSR